VVHANVDVKGVNKNAEEQVKQISCLKDFYVGF